MPSDQGLGDWWSDGRVVEEGVDDGESPGFEFGQYQRSAKRMLKLRDWKDVKEATKKILGYPTYDQANKKILRHLPENIPQFPELIAVRVSNLKGRAARGRQWYDSTGNLVVGTPGNDDRPMAAYERAALTVEYGFKTYNVLPDDHPFISGDEWYAGEWNRYVEYTAEPSAEFLNLLPGWLFWRSDVLTTSEKFPGNATKQEAKIEFMLTWHEIPAAYWAFNLARQSLGKVNKYKFLVSGLGDEYKPHTLLFSGMRYERVPMNDGVLGLKVQYIFQLFEKLHTRFFNFRRMAYEQVSFEEGISPIDETTAEDGKLVFDSIDFRRLFLADGASPPSPPPP